jgi:drug/metabolite transporter (DMT)-like permease
VALSGMQKVARLREHIRLSGAPGPGRGPIASFFWVTLSMAMLAGLAAFAKYATQQGIDPLQVIFFRNLFCLLCLSPLLVWRGRSLLQSRQMHLYTARVLINFAAMIAWFYAVAMVPLAQLQAITFLSPIFATLCAIYFLRETVGVQRWAGIAVGLIGALIILRPGGDAFGAGQLIALASAIALGVIGPLVKQLTAEDDADKIVFLTNLGLMPLSLIPALLIWQWPPTELLLPLMGMGVCAVLGHLALVRGVASADASLASTFEFSRLPFAVVIGWLVFQEATDLWTWVGALVIFISAAYVTRREHASRVLGGGPLPGLDKEKPAAGGSRGQIVGPSRGE